ncbi:MAG: sulfite exporter TauE/SafE family protein [Lachnospiraceae bacterium]|nr:sulfite exporter TauE/SafE family protein [Lachnospiraceae bacterium]
MWLWILATLAAFFVKGLCGFANTLVFTSLLVFDKNNISISPVELLLGYPSNLILAWKNRKQLNPKVYVPLSFLVLAGSIPGAFMLRNLDAGIIKIVFGIMVILSGADILLRDSKVFSFRGSKTALLAIGVLSGVLCGLFGVGALLAGYIGRVTDTSDEFKANLSAVFITDNTFRIILYSVLGIITPESLRLSALLIPFMLMGLFAGIKSSEALDDKIVKRLVAVLLFISGLTMIIKNAGCI